jgi:carboxyl-terminal processing protease
LVRGVAIALLVVTILSIGFGAGMLSMWLLQRTPQPSAGGPSLTPTATSDAETRQQGLDRLQEILRILDDEFYDPTKLDAAKLMQGAAGGLVSAVGDPYTLYVEPLQATIIGDDMRGSFEGIGATVNIVEQGLVIVKVQPDSPALRADLKEQDIILKADDVSLAGLDLLEAISHIRGPKGTVVRLLIQRKGVAEPFVVPVTRDRVENPNIEARMLGGNIAYLYLAEFNALAKERLHDELKQLLDQDPAGLVLDLRGNPGGLLDMAVEVAGEFLPRGALVTTQRWGDGTEKEYRVTGKGIATEIPIVVLINGGSASASEIVSGALRDQHRALLIGEPTYGKGAVQNVHALSDGSSLRVTVARFYLPGGETPDGNPIQPDIAVTLLPEDAQAGADPQLDRAVEYLETGR